MGSPITITPDPPQVTITPDQAARSQQQGFIDHAWNWVNKGLIAPETFGKIQRMQMAGINARRLPTGTDINGAIAEFEKRSGIAQNAGNRDEAYANQSIADVLRNDINTASRYTSPLAIGTLGIAPGLGSIKGIPTLVKAAAGLIPSTIFGAQGVKEALTPAAPGETSVESAARRAGGVGQAILGGTGVVQSRALAKGQPSAEPTVIDPVVAHELTGRGAQTNVIQTIDAMKAEVGRHAEHSVSVVDDPARNPTPAIQLKPNVVDLLDDGINKYFPVYSKTRSALKAQVVPVVQDAMQKAGGGLTLRETIDVRGALEDMAQKSDSPKFRAALVPAIKNLTGQMRQAADAQGVLPSFDFYNDLHSKSRRIGEQVFDKVADAGSGADAMRALKYNEGYLKVVGPSLEPYGFDHQAILDALEASRAASKATSVAARQNIWHGWMVRHAGGALASAAGFPWISGYFGAGMLQDALRAGPAAAGEPGSTPLYTAGGAQAERTLPGAPRELSEPIPPPEPVPPAQASPPVTPPQPMPVTGSPAPEAVPVEAPPAPAALEAVAPSPPAEVAESPYLASQKALLDTARKKIVLNALQTGKNLSDAQWRFAEKATGLDLTTPDNLPRAIEILKGQPVRKGRVNVQTNPSLETPGTAPGVGQAAPSAAAQVSRPVPQPFQPSGAVASGAGTSVSVPGESRSFAAHYDARELSELRPSHSGLNFAPTEGYQLQNDRDYMNAANQGKILTGSAKGKFDPAFMTTDNPDATNGPPVIASDGHVLGGNGRAMILQRVYKYNPDGATQYKDAIAQAAQRFGIDPAKIAGMKQPVLVRVIDDAEFQKAPAQNMVSDFNKSATAALTPSERAIADSKRVSQSTLDDIGNRLSDEGEAGSIASMLQKSGPAVIDRLISDGVVSPQEKAALIANGAITEAGKERVSKLVVGKFFDDPAQLEAVAPSIRGKLERIAAPLARATGDWDITPQVQGALRILDEASAHGIGIEDLMRQGSLLGQARYDPDAVILAKALKESSGLELTKMARRYASDAVAAKSKQGMMLGEPVARDQAFKEAFGK